MAFRSLYVETLSTLDIAEPAKADRCELPRFEFRDWPAAIYPDGRQLALGTAKHPIVWKRGGPKPIVAAGDKKLPRSRVAYGPKGKYLAELLSDEIGGGLRLWDPDATRMLGELIAPHTPGSVIRAVGFDDKETRLLVARGDGRVSGWDLPSLKPRPDWHITEKSKHPLTAAAFEAGAHRVAFGDGDGHVIAFDEDGKILFRRSPLPAKPVDALAWDAVGKKLAIGTGDGSVHVFDADGSLRFRSNVSASGVSWVMFSPDGRLVTAHFRDRPGRYWDATTGQIALVDCWPAWGFAHDGRTIAASMIDAAAFQEISRPEVITRWEGHRAPIDHVRWAANSRRLASLASDFEVRVWDVGHQPGRQVAAFPAPRTSGFWAMQGFVALSPDGRRLAYASGGEKESIALVFDIEHNRVVNKWNLPGGFEKLAANGPDRFVLVREQTTPENGNVTTVVYDLAPGQPLGPGRVIRKPRQ